MRLKKRAGIQSYTAVKVDKPEKARYAIYPRRALLHQRNPGQFPMGYDELMLVRVDHMLSDVSFLGKWF